MLLLADATDIPQSLKRLTSLALMIYDETAVRLRCLLDLELMKLNDAGQKNPQKIVVQTWRASDISGGSHIAGH